MGSLIEINDTLQITKNQGFPAELDIEKHIKLPIDFATVKDKIFHFQNKPKIRVYHQPPVRNFLVENLDGKWLYWGLCEILSLNIDYENQATSGTYKIVQLNSPEDMRKCFQLVHFGKNEEDYFEEEK